MTANTFNQYEQTVYSTAIAEGASDSFARILIAQLKHESADFTSHVFKTDNNPMGMKMPSVRKTPYIAGKGLQPPGKEGATPYAHYNNLSDAVKDLFNWLNYNKINWKVITSVPVYAELLRQKSYMGNTQEAKNIYIAGLTRYLNGVLGKVSGANSFVILFIIALFSYFLIVG
jgi:hypothetical protein